MRRASSLVVAVALVLAAAAAAGAQELRLYLTKPFALTDVVPSRPVPRDNAAISVRSGGSEAFAEFISSPLAADFAAGAGEVTLFLATGQQGMAGCAEVGVMVTRITPSGRSVIGNAALATSILPRRDAGPAIVVPFDAEGTALAAGDQIALEISVGNACGEGRNVTLLYDSLAAASRVDLGPPAPPGSSTTTTTTPPAGTTTTTSTLPPSVECAEFPHGTFAAVDCWYAILTRVVGDAGRDALGGPRRERRLEKRVATLAGPLEKAEAGRRADRRLAVVSRRLGGLRRQIDRLAGAGKMDAPLGVEISGVVTGMLAEVEALRTAAP
jgi:hypothetical protein